MVLIAVLTISPLGGIFSSLLIRSSMLELFPKRTFILSDMYHSNYTLEKGSVVRGVIDTPKILTRGDEGITFMVVDSRNFESWLRRQQVNYLLRNNILEQFTFTFKVEKADIYFFIFDNERGMQKREVTFAASVEMRPDANEMAGLSAYWFPVLLLLGIGIIGYGIARKQPVRWA